MKLNPKVLRYMSAEEFRVLTAVPLRAENTLTLHDRWKWA
jgi:hypothetical protein